jgi:hypothetical protein
MAQAYRLQYNNTVGNERQYKLSESNSYATNNGTMEVHYTQDWKVNLTQQIKQVQGNVATICNTQNGIVTGTLTQHPDFSTAQLPISQPWLDRKMCFQRSSTGEITHLADPDEKTPMQLEVTVQPPPLRGRK